MSPLAGRQTDCLVARTFWLEVFSVDVVAVLLMNALVLAAAR